MSAVSPSEIPENPVLDALKAKSDMFVQHYYSSSEDSDPFPEGLQEEYNKWKATYEAFHDAELKKAKNAQLRRFKKYGPGVPVPEHDKQAFELYQQTKLARKQKNDQLKRFKQYKGKSVPVWPQDAEAYATWLANFDNRKAQIQRFQKYKQGHTVPQDDAQAYLEYLERLQKKKKKKQAKKQTQNNNGALMNILNQLLSSKKQGKAQKKKKQAKNKTQNNNGALMNILQQLVKMAGQGSSKRSSKKKPKFEQNVVDAITKDGVHHMMKELDPMPKKAHGGRGVPAQIKGVRVRGGPPPIKGVRVRAPRRWGDNFECAVDNPFTHTEEEFNHNDSYVDNPFHVD
tara:strand:- start:12311 stop:13339 length:1029 start_codon:yes stop_codon:yes gene_type:complete